LNNGNANARAGIGVFFGPNDVRNLSEKFVDGKPSNQRAEVKAAIRALELIDLRENLEIRTDSKYLINGITEWRKTWQKNGWKTSNGTPVQNEDLFRALILLVDKWKGKLRWKYVEGHKGEPGNESADKLAVAGANS
jgi:ribonuclease HI